MVCYSATGDWLKNKCDNLCCSYNLSSLLSTQAYPRADKNTFFFFSIRYLGKPACRLFSQSSAFLFISHPFSQGHPPSLPWMVYSTDTSHSPLPLYALQLGSPWISVPTGIWTRITIALVDLIYGRLFSLWTRIFFPLPVLLSFPLSLSAVAGEFQPLFLEPNAGKTGSKIFKYLGPWMISFQMTKW